MKTIQQLREARGESRAQLARAIGVMPKDVADWETGRTEPTMSRLRLLTEHFGVRDDQIDLRPGHAPSMTERLGKGPVLSQRNIIYVGGAIVLILVIAYFLGLFGT